jgi:hypothetical protein
VEERIAEGNAAVKEILAQNEKWVKDQQRKLESKFGERLVKENDELRNDTLLKIDELR